MRKTFLSPICLGLLLWKATCVTQSIVWRPEKAKSVVQNMLSAFFTGNSGTPKKQSLSESALKSIDCPKVQIR